MGNGDMSAVFCDSTPEGDWETISFPIPPELEETTRSFVSMLRIEEIIIGIIDDRGISFLKIEGSKIALNDFRGFVSLLKKTDL